LVPRLPFGVAFWCLPFSVCVFCVAFWCLPFSLFAFYAAFWCLPFSVCVFCAAFWCGLFVLALLVLAFFPFRLLCLPFVVRPFGVAFSDPSLFVPPFGCAPFGCLGLGFGGCACLLVWPFRACPFRASFWLRAFSCLPFWFRAFFVPPSLLAFLFVCFGASFSPPFPARGLG